MPTFQLLPRFNSDWEKLSDDQREMFRKAVRRLIEDLGSGRSFRKGLRVKRIQLTDDVFEMTFSPDGRATWQYGPEVTPGEPHVIWRRIGTHAVLRTP
jgi:hypothetical protein